MALILALPARKKGRKDRKFGRNKVKCAHYRLHRSVRNKLAKLRNHLALHVNDECAIAALARVR